MLTERNLRERIAIAALAAAADLPALEQTTGAFLGGDGKFTALMKQLGTLPKEERPAAGKAINAAKAELDARKVPYWSMTGINGPQAEQIFLRDPQNNMIELHQHDQCRCRIANRR